MKKTIILISGLMVFCLIGCHQHEWVEATCTEPKTCSSCGETEGEALGHSWIEATCTEPKTCERCGETSGKVLGHDVKEYTITKEATCSEQGSEEGVCSRCGKTIEKTIYATGEHSFGDWVVTKEATYDEAGSRERTCSVCGKKETETIDSQRDAAAAANPLMTAKYEHKSDASLYAVMYISDTEFDSLTGDQIYQFITERFEKEPDLYLMDYTLIATKGNNPRAIHIIRNSIYLSIGHLDTKSMMVDEDYAVWIKEGNTYIYSEDID